MIINSLFFFINPTSKSWDRAKLSLQFDFFFFPKPWHEPERCTLYRILLESEPKKLFLHPMIQLAALILYLMTRAVVKSWGGDLSLSFNGCRCPHGQYISPKQRFDRERTLQTWCSWLQNNSTHYVYFNELQQTLIISNRTWWYYEDPRWPKPHCKVDNVLVKTK